MLGLTSRVMAMRGTIYDTLQRRTSNAERSGTDLHKSLNMNLAVVNESRLQRCGLKCICSKCSRRGELELNRAVGAKDLTASSSQISESRPKSDRTGTGCSHRSFSLSYGHTGGIRTAPQCF